MLLIFTNYTQSYYIKFYILITQQTTSGCRQAKMFPHEPDKKLSRYASSVPRRELKILVGLLTGHVTLTDT